jgi:hypothetical protein
VIAATALSTTASAQARVKNIYASTTKLDVELLQNSEQTVQLNRWFYAGYNTLCLPMTLTAEQLQAAAKDVRVERLAAIRQEGSTLNLYFVDCTAEGIQAGMPYLVYSPTSQYLRTKNTEAMNVSPELRVVRLSDGEGNQVTFGSGWEDMTKAGRYGIPAKQNVTPLESVLIRTEGDKNFLPTRCGFMWDKQSASASELVIKHAADMSEVTAIVGVEQVKQSADCYDLSGRKVIGQAKKGIYVVGREKVIK